MSAHDLLAAALESVVGAEWLLTDTATTDYTIDGMIPALVAVPEDEDQVSAVLRLADEHQATVFPHGGGNHTTLGNTPSQVDVVLSVRRLQQQLAYEPGDMTTTVQAGMRLADIQSTLQSNSQFIALDPSGAETATVGGIVATNPSGPRRLLYGSTRDLLLGSAVISVNGKRTKAGGRVVKNVTGYDLNKLYIGSLGTLAVIVELTWKVHPLPLGEHTIGIDVTTQADLSTILQSLLQLPLRLSSLTVLNAATCEILATDMDAALSNSSYLILARVEGSESVNRSQEQRLVAALRTLSLSGHATPHTWENDIPERMWQRIAELPTTLAATKPESVVSKVSLRLTDLAIFFDEMQTASRASGAAWPVFAHAGDGIAYIAIDGAPPTSNSPDPRWRHIQALDECVNRLRGHRVLEYVPLAIKRQCDVWGTPGDDFSLIRAIKTSFDPHNRLNPGRFLGGL